MGGRVRYRAVAVAAACAVLVVTFAAAYLDFTKEKPLERYWQHEQATQLENLPEADRLAAGSTTTDAQTFASHLPVVSIETGGQVIPGQRTYSEDEQVDSTTAKGTTLAPDGRTTIATTFSLFAHDGAANRLSDAPALATQAEMRVRGHSSRLFDKKSYQVVFTEDDRLTQKELDVLGMGADETWALNGPFLDKTMLRNYLALNLAGEFLPYTPDVRLCELFVDGSYQGVYLLMETVKQGPDRVALTESDPKVANTSYLVKRDWADATSTTALHDLLTEMRRAEGTPLEILYPTYAAITPQQRSWISSDVNAWEKALYSYDYDTSVYGYWNTLDVDSFVDYDIINELFGNVDAGRYSTYFYKDVRGKVAAGPVWDFNNALDNYMEQTTMEMGFLFPDRPLWYMLYKDEKFTARVISRYKELRRGVLSDDHMLEKFDAAVAYLGPAVDRNYQVWGYTFDPALVGEDCKLVPDERNPISFDQACDHLREALTFRSAWIDRNIETLRQFSHESAVKKFNH